MKILIAFEWWVVQAFHLACGLAELAKENKDLEVDIVGKQWIRPDFHPLTKTEEKCIKEPNDALCKLSSGYYDYAVFAEGSMLLYASQHLVNSNKTKLVLLDTTDGAFIFKTWLEHCSIYIKYQYPKGDLCFVSSSVLTEPVLDTSKIYPAPYPAMHRDLHAEVEGIPVDRDIDVYFSGWASNKDRIEAVSALNKSTKFSFYGGLYKRPDLPINCNIPDEINIQQGFSREKYHRLLKRSKVVINLRGNGWLCFRLTEAFRLGSFCVSQPLENTMVPEPVDGEHLVYCKADFSNLEELCYKYVQDKKTREKIGKNAREFYLQHWSPLAIAKYLVGLLNGYKRNSKNCS